MTSCGAARRYEQLPTVEEELTQRWAGKEYSDIVQAYSAPDRIVPDGKDGSILVYETISTSMSTSKSLMFDNYSTTVKEDKEYMHFFLNPEGFCYLVKTNQLVEQVLTDHGLSAPLTELGYAPVFLMAMFTYHYSTSFSIFCIISEGLKLKLSTSGLLTFIKLGL